MAHKANIFFHFWVVAHEFFKQLVFRLPIDAVLSNVLGDSQALWPHVAFAITEKMIYRFQRLL